MLELILAMLCQSVQLLSCVVIFWTGALWLNDLPLRCGPRAAMRKLALVLITGASAFQVFRAADPYVCVLLVGIALELVTQREAWLRRLWHGHDLEDYRGLERRRSGGVR